MIQFKKRFAYHDICFTASMLLALPFLIWKCRYGYGGGDEPFYLTLAQRLSQGDALLSEEWNLAQLSGFLLLPFYRIHAAVFGSTEGIILHFRYLYVIMQTLVCILLYLNLRRYRFGAVCAVVLFYLYAPYDIMALSYNTMGLMAITLCLTMTVTRQNTARYLFSGLCYAIAVLCNPYLISIYLLYLLLWMIAQISSRILKISKSSRSAILFPQKPLLLFTLGAAIPAFILLLFTLSRAGLSEISENLKLILHDPEHSSRSFYSAAYSYFYVMLHSFKTFLAAWIVILFIALSDRNKYRNAWMYFCMTALLTAIAVLIHIPSVQTDYNYIMFPLTACGFTAYLLTRKKNHRLFLLLWCTGILYTFCLSWASNQGTNSVCMGMPVVLVGSVILIWEFLTEPNTYNESRTIHAQGSDGQITDNPRNFPAASRRYTTPLTVCIAVLLLLSQLGAECYAKSVHAFWEPSVRELNISLTGGPLDGLLTTQEHADAYAVLLSEIENYRAGQNTQDTPVLFISSSPWCYLYAERSYGVYSSWISAVYSAHDPIDVLQERLGSYYRLHPDKIPVQVYIAKDDQWDFSFLSSLDYADCYQLFQSDPLSGRAELYHVRESLHGYHLSLERPTN